MIEMVDHDLLVKSSSFHEHCQVGTVTDSRKRIQPTAVIPSNACIITWRYGNGMATWLGIIIVYVVYGHTFRISVKTESNCEEDTRKQSAY